MIFGIFPVKKPQVTTLWLFIFEQTRLRGALPLHVSKISLFLWRKGCSASFLITMCNLQRH